MTFLPAFFLAILFIPPFSSIAPSYSSRPVPARSNQRASTHAFDIPTRCLAMAFPENSAALKFDFALDVLLFIFSMVSLITLAIKLTEFTDA